MTQLRVYVNATAVDVAVGATAIECVRAWRGDEADAVTNGSRLITDSRGLAIATDAPASAGSIFRTISNKASARAD